MSEVSGVGKWPSIMVESNVILMTEFSSFSPDETGLGEQFSAQIIVSEFPGENFLILF